MTTLHEAWRNRLALATCKQSARNYDPDAPTIGSNGEPFWKEFLPEADAAIQESLSFLQGDALPAGIQNSARRLAEWIKAASGTKKQR